MTDADILRLAISDRYPGVRVMTPLANAARTVLDIQLSGVMYTVEILVGGEIGVSRLLGSLDSLSGHDEVFPGINEAKRYLFESLDQLALQSGYKIGG